MIVAHCVAWVCVRHVPSRNVCGDSLRFCQRPKPFVVTEQFSSPGHSWRYGLLCICLLELAPRQWVVCLGLSLENQGCGPVLPVLLIDPLAVRAQARLPRCSSVCARIVVFLFCCSMCCWPTILPTRSCTSPASHICKRGFSSACLSDSFGDICQQSSAPMSTEDGSGLVTIECFFKALSPSCGAARYTASRNGHR